MTHGNPQPEAKYYLRNKIVTRPTFPYFQDIWEARATVEPMGFSVTVQTSHKTEMGATAQLVLTLRKMGVMGKIKQANTP